MPTSTKAEEFFYTENGKKQDLLLHEPILWDGDHEAAFEITREWLRSNGWTEKQIAEFQFSDGL